MNCKRAKKSIFLYWELPFLRQKQLDSHLERCPGCKEEFHTLSSSIQVCRQAARVEDKPETWSGYWGRLSRRLVKPSLGESVLQKLSSTVSIFNRSVWGPVPAYAVIAGVLLLTVAIFPVSKTSNKGLLTSSQFKNGPALTNLELVSATSQGSLTVYAVDRR